MTGSATGLRAGLGGGDRDLGVGPAPSRIVGTFRPDRDSAAPRPREGRTDSQGLQQQDEGGDLGLRVGAVELASAL